MITPAYVQAMATYNSEMNRRMYAATDGQEDAPNPLVALPATSLQAVRRTRIVFAHA